MTHAHCPTQSRHVSLDQTEGQCRGRHNCSDAACPLEKQFDRPRFSRRQVSILPRASSAARITSSRRPGVARTMYRADCSSAITGKSATLPTLSQPGHEPCMWSMMPITVIG